MTDNPASARDRPEFVAMDHVTITVADIDRAKHFYSDVVGLRVITDVTVEGETTYGGFAIQDGVWVTADRSLIRTVVQNLVENAWKFTARRDGATIEFATTTADDAGICCYVRDNGAGFDPAYAGQPFQPFQRLHAAGEFPGTGIGLASVQRIIERHGGRTWAQGAIDGGATFYFTLDAVSRPGSAERPVH